MRLFVIYYRSAIHNKKNMGPKLKYLFIISKLFKTFCKKIKPIYVDTQANPCLFRIYITTVQRNFSIRSVALDWDHSSDVLGYRLMVLESWTAVFFSIFEVYCLFLQQTDIQFFIFREIDLSCIRFVRNQFNFYFVFTRSYISNGKLPVKVGIIFLSVHDNSSTSKRFLILPVYH